MKVLKLLLLLLAAVLFFLTSCKPVDVVQRTRKVTMDKQPSVIITTELRTYSWYGRVKEIKNWSIVVVPIEYTDSIKLQEKRRLANSYFYSRK